MKFLILVIVFDALIAFSSAALIVCYYHEWAIYRSGAGKFGAAQIDPNLCTHIVYAYVGLNPDGSVQIRDTWAVNGLKELDHLLALKADNPDLKLLFAVGGWSDGVGNYSMVAGDGVLRNAFVESAVEFVLDHKFDGLSFDWEFPGQRDGSDPVNDPGNYVITITALKLALNKKDLILASALPGGKWGVDTSFPNAKQVVKNLDLAFIRTFDYHGSWDTIVAHNAPLAVSTVEKTADQKQQNVEAGIQYWLDKGADKEKLILGIPLYGRSYTLLNPAKTELYAPNNGSGVAGPYTQESGLLGYNEICEYDNDWDYYFDEEQQVPHIIKDDQWVGYDDDKSILAKVNLINELGLGGALVWTLDTDDFSGRCGDKFPLTNTVKDNLK